MARVSYWPVPPAWAGQTAYIVGGGPSVADLDLAVLRGRRTIAINSSCFKVPFADYLIFADPEWWDGNKDMLSDWSDRVVAVSSKARDHGPIALKRLRRTAPDNGLPAARDSVPLDRTTTTAAIGMAVHLGARRIVLIGIDQCRAPDGRCHHHAPHRHLKNKPGNGSWDAQMPQLRALAAPLAAAGVEVLNCSPTSRIDWWPKVTLAEAIDGEVSSPQPPGIRESRRMANLDSREFDMLKRRGFRDYSVGHQRMYTFPIDRLRGKRYRIFEAGFGIGFGLRKMLEADIVERFIGCEPNLDSYNYTFGLFGTRPEVTLHHCPFGQPVLPTPPADHTFCIEVIEHVPADAHAEFLSLLRACGPRLWLSTPDIARQPREGVRTTEEWEAMLRAAGFDKVDVDRSQWTHLFACE